MAPLGHIVVAEDDDADALLAGKALLQAKVAAPVTFVRDGIEVINFLNHNGRDPVLLLLDLHMPKMDGFEVLQWLDHREMASEVSVIVLSSSGESDNIRRAAELGAVCYIVKPNDPEELVHVMQRAQELWLGRLSSTTGPFSTACSQSCFPAQESKGSTPAQFPR